jgi:GH15 family glucan-1,4-alpha-glucosidase
VSGSLQNVVVVQDGKTQQGFIFSLLNPPVPLGGNIISLDVYVDDLPMPRKIVFIATQEDTVNAASLSETRPIPFKPFQSARFVVINGSGLQEKRRHKVVVMSKMEGFEQIVIPFTFVDRARQHGGKIMIPEQALEPEPLQIGDDATMFKNFTAPLVLSGRKAYVVCSSHGALSANWTWMGVRYDNGGLYVPPARALGKVVVEISMDDGVRKRLPSFVVSSKHENGILETRHELAGLEVRRKLVVPFENRGFIMALELRLFDGLHTLEDTRARTKHAKRKIRIHFLIDGNITSYGLAAVSQSTISTFDPKNNCLVLRTAAQKGIDVQYFATIGIAPAKTKPDRILTDSYDNDLELSYDLELETGKPTIKLALIGTGGFSGQASCLKEYLYMRENYARLVEETESGFKSFSKATLSVRPPSSPERNSKITELLSAYEKAKTCLRYLKTEYDGLGEGISAGLPRFPNYWARDTGWALRGYLAIGDYRFAAATMDNFLRRQAKKTTKTAIKGELPMIISGKAFLHETTYGSADSTFLFPRALLEYVLATGNLTYLEKRWDAVASLIEWGFLRDVDGDGLVENDFTGIAEKLPIQDSTWMDHIDRRKSANDIQALFYESLVIGSRLAELVGDVDRKKRWTDGARRLQEKIELEYWNPKAGFYYDTVRKDGSKDPSIRPNALVLLLTNAVADRNKATSVLRRIEEPDMTTAWGVRTLSSEDPRYNPTLYHDGAVWPVVTGWAALSELSFERREQALRYVESMAQRILSENGMFAETYRGDRPEPFNSCILQAWSVSMYAHAFRELMLGMDIDMIQNKVMLEPKIPESLKAAITHPLTFDFFIPHNSTSSKLSVVVEPRNEKISVSYSGGKRPEIISNSYAVTDINF